MLHITAQQIKDKNPCAHGWSNFRTRIFYSDYIGTGWDTPISYITIIKHCPLSDVIWSLQCTEEGLQVADKLVKYLMQKTSKSERSPEEFVQFFLKNYLDSRFSNDNKLAISDLMGAVNNLVGCMEVDRETATARLLQFLEEYPDAHIAIATSHKPPAVSGSETHRNFVNPYSNT